MTVKPKTPNGRIDCFLRTQRQRVARACVLMLSSPMKFVIYLASAGPRPHYIIILSIPLANADCLPSHLLVPATNSIDLQTDMVHVDEFCGVRIFV